MGEKISNHCLDGHEFFYYSSVLVGLLAKITLVSLRVSLARYTVYALVKNCFEIDCLFVSKRQRGKRGLERYRELFSLSWSPFLEVRYMVGRAERGPRGLPSNLKSKSKNASRVLDP